MYQLQQANTPHLVECVTEQELSRSICFTLVFRLGGAVEGGGKM